MKLPRLALLAAAALLLLGTASEAAADAAPHILMDATQQRPTSFLAAAQAGPPTGPAIPTLQDGIGPGSGLRMYAKAGDQAGFLCTGAFLLRDPATATYYLSTAGHCVVRDETDATPYTGKANPDKVNQEVDICVQSCIDNALAQGTYVQLVSSGNYTPVWYGESGGPGQDFGLVEIPPDRHGLLRPWMPQFGGPTGYDPSQSGDLLVHYGHGTYCCPSPVGGAVSRTPADQGRVATSLGATSLFGAAPGHSFSAVGSSTGGDSGSGVAIGSGSATRGIQGGAAVGVLTHGVNVEGVPYFEGTTLAHGLEMVKAATGLELQLVLQDDPLTAAPDPLAAAAPHVAILDPAPGATVRPGSDGTTFVQGSAGKGNQTTPAGALVQLAVDDAAFGTDSRVPVAGNDTWAAQWDLHGVALGPHVLYARLVAADGKPLAAVNQTVTVAARGSTTSSGPSSGPGPSSSQPGATGKPSGTASGGGTAAGSKTTRPGSSTTNKSPLPAFLPVVALAAVAAALRRKR